MRAIQIDRYGGPEVLIRRELPVPAPGPDEVLIRLAYSGVNFMDIHTREGKYAGSRTYPQTLPTTLGIEGAGTIEVVGSRVGGFRVGDRVAYCLSWGSYADYAAVAAWRVVHVPEALPLERAAASMFHGLTAHYLAHDVGKLGRGVTCLVHSASGGIGQLLVQIGAQLGATVYATTSTEAKAQVARDRGAKAAFLYDDGRFADTVRDLTGGRGVDVVFDPVGQPTLRDSLRATRTKGLVVSFGSVGGNVTDLNPIELGEAGSLFSHPPSPCRPSDRREYGSAQGSRYFRGVDRGDVVNWDCRPIHVGQCRTSASKPGTQKNRRQASYQNHMMLVSIFVIKKP